MDLLLLKEKAREIRLHVLDDIYRTQKGAIGGIYSATDLFVYLYYGEYGLRRKNDAEHDHLILGKGHASLALYYIWADKGMIPEEWLEEYGKNGGKLGGQLYIGLPYVEYSSGSLGHALGIAAGYALADRLNKKETLALAFVGDGECAEGSIWEAVSLIGSEKLYQVGCIVDYNELGVTDFVAHEGGAQAMATRFESYGWQAKIIDGHSFEDIALACKMLHNQDRPTVIIAKTLKGKGVSFMENEIKWHNSIPSDEEYQLARKELSVS